MKKAIIFCILSFFISNLNLSAKTDVNSSVKADTIVQEESHSVFTKVIDWYNSNLNYVSVTLLMTIESSFIPLPSEIVVPPAAYQACNPDNTALYVTDSPVVNILFVLLAACVGAILGALINYFLALCLGRPFIYWFADSKIGHLLMLSGKKIKKAEDYFVEHGNISTFVGRLIPVIRQLISIPAGLAKMNLGHFILYTTLGASLWNIILAFIGYLAHGQQDIINKYNDELSHAIIAIFVVVICYFIIKKIVKNRRAKQ